VQIVGYRTAPAALLLADGGRVERRALTPGTDLEYALGERHCAGLTREARADERDRDRERGGDAGQDTDADGDGDRESPPLVHEPCDAPGAPHCEAHTVPWAAANNADSEEEHAVYLAAFAPDTFKVGVTRTWRLETRLREQGADRGAHVRTMADGRVARNYESQVASRPGPSGDPIGDSVRVARKVAGLHRAVDEAAWEALLEEFDVRGRYRFDYGLDLDRQPVPETLATGTVVGTKGLVLVLARGGTTYAVDLRDLVGYEVSEDRESRDRQSSLGQF
jgi:hypothetical protein